MPTIDKPPLSDPDWMESHGDSQLAHVVTGAMDLVVPGDSNRSQFTLVGWPMIGVTNYSGETKGYNQHW